MVFIERASYAVHWTVGKYLGGDVENRVVVEDVGSGASIPTQLMRFEFSFHELLDSAFDRFFVSLRKLRGDVDVS